MNFFCPNCGADLNDSARFCGKCGARLPIERIAAILNAAGTSEPPAYSVPATHTILQYETARPEAPIDSAPVAVEKAEVPVEDAPVFADKAEAPVEDAPVFAEKAEVPVEDVPVFADKAEAPVENVPVFAEKEEAPVEDAPVFADKAEVPVEDAPVFADKAEAPVEDAPVFADKAEAPVEDAPVFAEKAEVPVEDVPVFADKAEVPVEDVPASMDKAEAPTDEIPIHIWNEAPAESPAEKAVEEPPAYSNWYDVELGKAVSAGGAPYAEEAPPVAPDQPVMPPTPPLPPEPSRVVKRKRNVVWAVISAILSALVALQMIPILFGLGSLATARHTFAPTSIKAVIDTASNSDGDGSLARILSDYVGSYAVSPEDMQFILDNSDLERFVEDTACDFSASMLYGKAGRAVTAEDVADIVCTDKVMEKLGYTKESVADYLDSAFYMESFTFEGACRTYGFDPAFAGYITSFLSLAALLILVVLSVIVIQLLGINSGGAGSLINGIAFAVTAALSALSGVAALAVDIMANDLPVVVSKILDIAAIPWLIYGGVLAVAAAIFFIVSSAKKRAFQKQ